MWLIRDVVRQSHETECSNLIGAPVYGELLFTRGILPDVWLLKRY